MSNTSENIGCGAVIVAIILGSSIFISNHPDTIIQKKIDVTRIFLDGERAITVLVNDGDGKFHVESFTRIGRQPAILADVPADKTMFIEYDQVDRVSGTGLYGETYFNIHVHSISSIEGGSYDYGKLGHGKLVPLEKE